MAVLTIPFDYQTGRYQRSLIPICIRDTDENGQQIEWRWFEAAAKMADAATFDMRLCAHSWDEIADALGCEVDERGRNLLSVRLSRAIRRVVRGQRTIAL